MEYGINPSDFIGVQSLSLEFSSRLRHWTPIMAEGLITSSSLVYNLSTDLKRPLGGKLSSWKIPRSCTCILFISIIIIRHVEQHVILCLLHFFSCCMVLYDLTHLAYFLFHCYPFPWIESDCFPLPLVLYYLYGLNTECIVHKLWSCIKPTGIIHSLGKGRELGTLKGKLR